jgi:hypothetical protein
MPAPPSFEHGQREEPDIDQGDPFEDRPRGVRRRWLSAADQPLISRGVEQLDAALRTKCEQDQRI